MMPNSLKTRIIALFDKIFNNFIPQQFKNSIVVPIPKPGKNKTNICSYSCLSRTLDKIVANRLRWFVTNNKLLNNRQFGFRKGSSAIEVLLLQTIKLLIVSFYVNTLPSNR